MKTTEYTQEKKTTLKKKQHYSPILKVKLTRKNATSEGLSHVQEYLVRFGYLKHNSYTGDRLDDATSEALSKFQERFRLERTGLFDENTRNQMGVSRCGLPDMRSGIEFSTKCCWNRRNLTFAFNNGTNDISGTGEFQAVRNAFQTWAAVIPFTFTEVNANQNPDVLIDWRPANDPDQSMVGGVIAHSDFPPGCSVIVPQNTLPLPLHFDDSENTWVTGAVVGALDVASVALHEIGHILGLQHSTVPGAVMWPSISSNAVLQVLTQDDINGVQSCYGRRFPARPGTTVTALQPFPGHVDLFVTATDGAVGSTFFEPDGGWRNWFLIHSEVRMQPGATVTALQPFEGHIDLFVTGTDGAVWSTFFEPDGGWRNWFLIHSEVRMQPGATVTALQPFEGHIDLFVTGTDGAVWSTFFEPDGGWRNWFPIHSEIRMQPGATVTVVQPFEGHIDLFVTGTDGAVWSTFFESDGGWRNWFPIHSEIRMQPGATVTVVQPFEGHIDLFVTGTDGAVWSTFFESDGGWRNWFLIHSEVRMQPGATVTALQPFEGHIDLFVTGTDGAVWSTFFEPDGGWRNWFLIHSEVRMQPGATVTALQPFEGHIDLFVTGTDGAVWSTFFESDGGWRNWFLVP